MSTFKANDFSNYTVDEFLLDDNFIHWVKNEPDKVKELKTLYPYQVRSIDQAMRIIKAVTIEENFPESLAEVRVWKRLLNSMSEQDLPKRNRILQLTTLHKIAAVFVTFLVFTSLAAYILRNFNRSEINTSFGEITKIALPDQSEVVLNANSKIHYDKKWKKGAVREVWVEGEAFFNVKHINKDVKNIRNEERFIVHLGKMDVEVLGTSFNVNNRHSLTKISLNSGKISLHIKGSNQQFFMKPGELAEYSSSSENLVIKDATPDRYSSWKDHQFKFINTPLSEIATMIQDIYGYKVIFENETLNRKTVSGTLSAKNEDVLFRALSTTLNLEFQKNADKKQVVIRNRKSIK